MSCHPAAKDPLAHPVGSDAKSRAARVVGRYIDGAKRALPWLARHAPGTGHDGREVGVAWAMFLGFVAAKVATFWGQKPFVGGDHGVWLSCGGSAFFSKRLWACHRPPVVPLVHKLFDFDELGVMWLQVAASTLTWALLAWSASRFVQHAATRSLAFGGFLLLGMVAPFHAWDFSVRSESLAHTFALGTLAWAMIAVAARLGVVSSRATVPALAATVVTALLAVGSRDLNALWILGVAVVLVVGLFLGGGWRASAPRFGAAAGALVVLALLGSWSTVAAGRHEKPFAQVVMRRILTDERRTEVFRNELGMPYDEHVAALAGKWYSKVGQRVRTRAEYAELHRWLRGDGFASYRGYLLRHLGDTAPEALRGLERTVRAKHGSDMREPSPDTPTGWVTVQWNRLSPIRTMPIATAAMAMAICLVSSVTRDGRRLVVALLGAFLVAMGVALAFFGYHGDAMEVARHSVFAVCSISIGAWVALVAVVDRAAAALSTRRGRERSAPPCDPAAWGGQLVGASLALFLVVTTAGIAKAATRYPDLASKARVEASRSRGDAEALVRGRSGEYCMHGARRDPEHLRLRFARNDAPTRMFLFAKGRGSLEVRVGRSVKTLEPMSAGSWTHRAFRFDAGTARVVEVRATSSRPVCLTRVLLH